jgi:hypothetical protein
MRVLSSSGASRKRLVAGDMIPIAFTSCCHPRPLADHGGPMPTTRGLAIAIATSFLLSFTPAHPVAGATTSVTLRWTTPGDDGLVGRAAAYDLRYSWQPITPETFLAATQVTGLSAPGPAGSPDSFLVTGLVPRAGYYFAMRTRDDYSNWSPVSNVVYRVLPPYVGVYTRTLAFSLSQAIPNPARHASRLDCTLPVPSRVQLDAFDTQGRHVRAIEDGERPAGTESLAWDLRDDTGRRVAPGLYFLVLRLPGARHVRRVMVVQ